MNPTKWIKVWSQAGATLVASIINMGLLFHWWAWTTDQVASVNLVYAGIMLVLRQMFSVTEDVGVQAGEIVIHEDEDGALKPSLELNEAASILMNNQKLTFTVVGPPPKDDGTTNP